MKVAMNSQIQMQILYQVDSILGGMKIQGNPSKQDGEMGKKKLEEIWMSLKGYVV